MYSWDIDDEEEEEKDIKFGGANLTVFLIEATNRMRVKVGEEGLDCVQTALGCAHATIKDKIITSPKDSVAVVTFGNPAKQTKECEFETVRQVIALSLPSSENILKLEDYTYGITGVNQFGEDYGYGDDSGVRLHEALWQCQTIVSRYKGKVASSTIILMTNSDKPHGDSKLNTQAQKKSSDLHNSKINLEVIPICDDPGSFTMKHFYEVNHLAHLSYSKYFISTPCQDLIKMSEDAAPLSIPHISDITSMVVKRTTNKRSNGKYLFDLGGGTVIGVSSYNLVTKKGKPTRQKLASDTNEPVTSKRTWTNPVNGAKLLPSDMKRFVSYGGQKIKFTEDEFKCLNTLEAEALPLQLCGFKPLSTLKYSKYVRSSHIIYPNEELAEGSRSVFSALLASCLKKNVMGVAKFKSRPLSGVSFVGLIPQREERDEAGTQTQPPGFHLVYLSWVDDTRPVPRTRLAEDVPREAVDTAKEIINKLKLKRLVPVENCAIQTPLSIIEVTISKIIMILQNSIFRLRLLIKTWPQ